MAKPSWITLDKSSGTGESSVKVAATGNASTSARSGTTFSWPDGSGRSVNINGPSEYSMDPYVKIDNERFNLYANTGLRTNTAGTWYRVSDDFTLSEDESIELTLGFLNT